MRKIVYLRSNYNLPTKDAFGKVLPSPPRTAVGCVVMEFSRDSNQVTFGVTTANPSDTFRKDIARQLAIGRYVEHPHTINLTDKAENISARDISKAVMNHIARAQRVNSEAKTEFVFPNRARKAAHKWLETSEKVSREKTITTKPVADSEVPF